ncbi:MAG: hypothetical protein CMI53_00705 [Parcubacteria group bacterium]|nr:hypothetical protein [Parcubacteria group bacterium]|tara:strand:- start:7751 stop:8389 length:639 start_codon:yes stop_codon:yes gene_type:complete
MLDQKGWIEYLVGLHAYWGYAGEACSERPHAKMNNGQHSGGFFDGRLVTRETSVCTTVCGDLLERLQQDGKVNPNSVWGSAMGAVVLAYELARQMNKQTGFTVKHVHDEGMSVGRFPVTEGEYILMVGDVLVTGTTTKNSIIALTANGAVVLPYILVLVNRSGLTEIEGRKIISLINRELPLWDEVECPYCKEGSKAVRPRENWAELNGVTV